MKPKTKLQHHIVEIDKSLPKITTEQRDYALLHCLDHVAVRLKSGKITCLDCAHTWKSPFTTQGWQDEVMGDTCSNCGVKVKIKTTRQKRFKDKNLFQIIDTHKKHQVIRTFHVYGYYFSGVSSPIEYQDRKEYRHVREVSRVYITPNGKYEIIGHTNQPTWSGERWTNDFCLKSRKAIKGHNLNIVIVYPKKKYIKEIKRNGFKNRFYKFSPFNVFHSILTRPKAETLLKSNQISLLDKTFYNYGSLEIERYWSSIKICIRNNYLIKNASDYFDYLSDLEELGKDLHNPKYVCPKDFLKAHQFYIGKRRKLRDKIAYEEKKKKIQEEEVEYLKLKKKFFGLEFKKGKLIIKVIESVQEIMEVGESLHHCIYHSNYHLKKNSLLLCAWVDGVPKETLEYSISNHEIIQSRGLQNKSSKFHKRIVKLVDENIPLIKKRMVVKRKRKQLKQVA